jgi:hypothetical protein
MSVFGSYGRPCCFFPAPEVERKEVIEEEEKEAEDEE